MLAAQDQRRATLRHQDQRLLGSRADHLTCNPEQLAARPDVGLFVPHASPKWQPTAPSGVLGNNVSSLEMAKGQSLTAEPSWWRR